MGQIRARFIDGADAVKPGCRGSSETGQLREDKPYPVAPLPAGAQFGEHGLEDRLLAATKRWRSKRSSVVMFSSLSSVVVPAPVMALGGSASSIQAGA